MERSKNFIIVIIIVIIIIIAASTGLKVYNTHIDNLYKAAEKKICEAVRMCYIDKNCEGNTVKIDELVSLKYLTKQVDPKTKEYINGDIVVYYQNGTCSVDIR